MPDGMLDPSKSMNIPYLIPQTAEDETTAFGWFKTETVVVDTLFFFGLLNAKYFRKNATCDLAPGGGT
jgi:hypothetical protein